MRLDPRFSKLSRFESWVAKYNELVTWLMQVWFCKYFVRGGGKGAFWMLKYQNNIILMIVLHSKQFSNSDMLTEIPQIMFHKHLWTISADQIWITFVLICIRWLMMAHYNCFKDILQCNQEVTVFVLIKTMYLQDLFQINTKIILNLAFVNYYCAIFLFIFLVASGEVGGGEVQRWYPPFHLWIMDSKVSGMPYCF